MSVQRFPLEEWDFEDFGLARFPYALREPPAIFLIWTLAEARQTSENTERTRDARGARAREDRATPFRGPYTIAGHEE